MISKRKSYNPKRAISTRPVEADLSRWSQSVEYGGNPEHKKNPGDFGLTPPASPRPDKTLCDGVGIFDRATALRLLREGVRRGLVSEQMRQGYPQNIWAVTSDGVAMEAQLENAGTGTYHGYPLQEKDPFRGIVLHHWENVVEH
ncbi:MAG TPA: hypothetical protein PK916_09670 [Bacteroidota bacterium]|nr:hypothetical protein [Bacteroidota bacterium]